jgi:hypothetical protein
MTAYELAFSPTRGETGSSQEQNWRILSQEYGFCVLILHLIVPIVLQKMVHSISEALTALYDKHNA